MSIIASAEPARWVVVVYDRDGDIINDTDCAYYESEAEAEAAGRGWEDHPLYGSHETELSDE